MSLNFPVLFLAALLPLVLGFIWYNDKAFGAAWMKVNGLEKAKLKEGNMLMIFGFTYLFSFFIAMALNFMVIHQWHMYSILANEPGLKDPNSEVSMMIKGFMDKYGTNFRTFKHGSFHGTLAGLLFAFPLVAINALFERRGFKYIFIHAGYWVLTLALMGGIICAYT